MIWTTVAERLRLLLGRPVPALLINLAVLLVVTLSPVVAAQTSADGAWRDLPRAGLDKDKSYAPRLAQVDLDLFRANLLAGEVSLPLPEGGYSRFLVRPSGVLPAALAARHPELQAYRGHSLDDFGVSASISVSADGVRALILSAADSVNIDPVDADGVHASVPKSAPGSEQPFFCEVHQGPATAPKLNVAKAAKVVLGERLFRYRVAITATPDYVAAQGGAESALAAIVATVDQVSAIYERDVAVRFELAEDNDQLIFVDFNVDPQADPFLGASFDELLVRNQVLTDDIIGRSNYDFGHLFTVGGGGVAVLNSVCDSDSKAQAVSSAPADELNNPRFFVDIVAHEFGHQFSATHTFNGDAGSCSSNTAAPQRADETAYEPGSGSTIMSYAGICADGADDQNIQGFSDDYFHAASVQQIASFVASSRGGGRCDAPQTQSNAAPTVNAGGGAEPAFTIPEETPFELTATGSDGDGDALTYTWEQFDLGDPGVLGELDREGPLFRSFPPTASASRTLPQIDQLLELLVPGDLEQAQRFEVLPDRSRELNFVVTARDGRGGIAQDELLIDVRAGGGAFLVTEPNSQVSWRGFDQRRVRWRVANTDSSPISCSAVDIRFSADGGRSFPLVAALATANDGDETVTVPNVDTEQARVKVSCSDNIFFNISESDFQIRTVGDPPVQIFSDGFESTAD